MNVTESFVNHGLSDVTVDWSPHKRWLPAKVGARRTRPADHTRADDDTDEDPMQLGMVGLGRMRALLSAVRKQFGGHDRESAG